jgi:RNA polymerase sigma factor (sigma-70 family)
MHLGSEDFSTLYRRHARELVGFFARRTSDPDVAVDLLAETFASAFRDRKQFRGRDLEEARAWLYGIGRHRLADYVRRGRVEQLAVGRLGVQRQSLTEVEYERIEELAATQNARDQLGVELDGLPREQRDAVRLRIVDGRSYADVARELGVNEEAARTRVSRALRTLRNSPVLRDLIEAIDNV